MESPIDNDVRLEWQRHPAENLGDMEIIMTAWGCIIRDIQGHILHAMMPKWWAPEQRFEVAQNLFSLIQLRSTL